MSARFLAEKKKSNRFGAVLATVLFFLVIIGFVGAVGSLRSRTDQRAKETLEIAINRCVTRCYSLEGAYPESLEALKANYGLSYDEERFFVDYHVSGKNIRPEITILDREAWK